MSPSRVGVLTLALIVFTTQTFRSHYTNRQPSSTRHVQAATLENALPPPLEIENRKTDESGLSGVLPLPGSMRSPSQRVTLMPYNPGPRPPGWTRDPEKENRILTIDRETGRVYEQDMPSLEKLLGLRYTENGVGLRELLEDPEGVRKMFSDWELVPDPTVGEFPRFVKLFMDFTSAEGLPVFGECSGTLIDPKHVITAAHCIWSHDIDGILIKAYADAVEVIPGFMNGNKPYGNAGFAQMHVWTLWIDDHDYDYDVGIIDLDRPIGALTGWWGYGTADDCSFYETYTWRHASYPGEDPFAGLLMYRNLGDFDDCDLAGWDYRMEWEGPSWGGSSGAGGVKTQMGAVFTVLSTSDRETNTQCVRLSPTKYDQVGQMILADKPPGLDLVAMDVNGPAQVESGFRLDFFDFLVLNYSQGSMSDTWPFDVYLSTDDVITTGDILVTSSQFTYSFGDNGRVLVSPVPPTIPAHVPTGNYFLGVLLTHADWDHSNNGSHGQEASPITVTCRPSDPPVQLSPIDAATCLSTNQFFNWQPVAPLANYQLQVGTVCGAGTIVQTQSTSYSWQGLSPSTTYHWRVRSQSQCASWGNWSPCWDFHTLANTSAVSSVTAPADGEHCQGTSVQLDWTPLPDAVTYDIQVSPVWCYEGTITTGIPNSHHTLTGLSPNTTYYWRVRSHTTCGQTTNWSSVPGFCWTFKTAPTSIDPPVMLGPPDGYSCGSPSTVLALNQGEDPDYSEVFVGTDCDTGTIYTTSSGGYTPQGLQSGVTYHWRARTFHECGLVSDWTSCRTFDLDLEPPTNPTTLTSNTHQVGVWSGDDTINTQWDWGWDNCDFNWTQYATLWDEAPDTGPIEPTTSGEITLETSPPLATGQSHWFHLRAVDWAGNPAQDVMHLGPFWIDVTEPSQPEVDFTTIDPGVPTGPTLLTMDWLPATDYQSGVAGYSWWVDVNPDPAGQPDLVVDFTEPTLTLELEQELDYWVFLRSIDTAGNGSAVTALGPFPLRHDLFGVGFFDPMRNTVVTEGDVFRIRWGLFDDGPAVLDSGQLAYSTDNGGSYHVIANLTPAQIQQDWYDWTVPADGSTQAMVRLTVIDTMSRSVSARSERFTINQVTSNPELPSPATDRFALWANHPNPFNPQTTITYTLPHATHVLLRVHDAQGRLVNTLVDEWKDGPANHVVVWSGRDANGRPVASGVYRCILETEEFQQSRAMVLAK